MSGKRPIEKESGKKRGTAGTTMWVLWNPLKVQRYQWVLVSPSWYRLRFFLSISKGSCFKWKWCHVLRCRTNWGSNWKSRGLNRFFTTFLKGNCLRMSAIILRRIKREAPLDGTRDTCLQAPFTAQCVIISMFHFSIPQVFQLIQWNKTTHLLLTVGSHHRFHKGKASLETWPSFLALSSDDSCAARLEINELAMVRQGWTFESCELQLPFPQSPPWNIMEMPWKCTVNKPHQRHWTRQRVTICHNARCFWHFQEAETDVQMEARRQLTHGAQYRTRFPNEPYFGLSIFFPKEKLSRRQIGPAPRDSEGDGWSKRSKCTLGFQVYPES